MPRYTEESEFVFNGIKDYRVIIPDSGTSVAVEFWTGSEWATDSGSPVTTPDKIFCPNVRVRLTPDTGGFYFNSEGES